MRYPNHLPARPAALSRSGDLSAVRSSVQNNIAVHVTVAYSVSVLSYWSVEVEALAHAIIAKNSRGVYVILIINKKII